MTSSDRERIEKLIAEWRHEAAVKDTFHATMGIGWKVCADDLEAALSAPLAAQPATEAREALYQDSMIAHRWFAKHFGEQMNGRDFAVKCEMADQEMAALASKLEAAEQDRDLAQVAAAQWRERLASRLADSATPKTLAKTAAAEAKLEAAEATLAAQPEARFRELLLDCVMVLSDHDGYQLLIDRIAAVLAPLPLPPSAPQENK